MSLPIKIETDVRGWMQKPQKSIRWYKFDRQTFEVYEAMADATASMPDDRNARLVAHGPHVLAALNQVPVELVQVPEGLWLANKVLPQVMDHLNVDNTYSWALMQANLAMPVITGKMQGAITLSEAGAINLPEGCTFGWTEPPGMSFQRSAERVEALREEIYRQMYLMPQGRSSSASASVTSGYSKSLEMTPSAEVQNLFSEILRASMRKSLNRAASVHGDNIEFDVRGLRTVLEPAMDNLQEAQAYEMLQVPSETARKENYKKVARARFTDSNSSLIDQMCEEIDQSPSMEDLQAQQQQQEQDQYSQQFQQHLDNTEVGEAQAETAHQRDIGKLNLQHKQQKQLQPAKSKGK